VGVVARKVALGLEVVGEEAVALTMVLLALALLAATQANQRTRVTAQVAPPATLACRGVPSVVAAVEAPMQTEALQPLVVAVVAAALPQQRQAMGESQSTGAAAAAAVRTVVVAPRGIAYSAAMVAPVE
jgi:hypothetical protein